MGVRFFLGKAGSFPSEKGSCRLTLLLQRSRGEAGDKTKGQVGQKEISRKTLVSFNKTKRIGILFFFTVTWTLVAWGASGYVG